MQPQIVSGSRLLKFGGIPELNASNSFLTSFSDLNNLSNKQRLNLSLQ